MILNSFSWYQSTNPTSMWFQTQFNCSPLEGFMDTLYSKLFPPILTNQVFMRSQPFYHIVYSFAFFITNGDLIKIAMCTIYHHQQLISIFHHNIACNLSIRIIIYIYIFIDNDYIKLYPLVTTSSRWSPASPDHRAPGHWCVAPESAQVHRNRLLQWQEQGPDRNPTQCKAHGYTIGT